MSKRQTGIIDAILENFIDIVFYGLMIYLMLGMPSCATDHNETTVKEPTQIEKTEKSKQTEQDVNQSGVKIKSL